MAVALRGNLEDFGIADVFQLIGQQRKTGVLEFSGETGQVQLRFDRGLVVSAAPVGQRAEEPLGEMLVRCGLLTREQVDRLVPECEASAQTVPRLAASRGWIEPEDIERIEDLLTRETFFEVLRWKRGAFDFRAVSVDHSRRMDSLLGAEQILMDGLRMIDEWQSFSELAPEDAVFQRSAGFEEYRARTRLDAEQVAAAECVYELVDGRSSVRRIVDLSLLGTFDAVRLLADLRRAEVIEPVPAEILARLRARASAGVRLERGQAVGWVAGLACVGLLGAVSLLALRGAPIGEEAPAPPGIEIAQDALGSLRAAYAARRVRHALETHRLDKGRWPEALAELEREGLLESGSLASAGGHPYYYRQRADGALLLAPER
jgi:hypothetical protein